MVGREELSWIMNFQDVHPLIWSYSHINPRDGCDGRLHQRIRNDCWLRFFWFVCNCVSACDVMCMYILYMFWICFVTLQNIALLMMLLAGDVSLRSAFLRRFSWQNRTKTSISFSFLQAKGMSSFPWKDCWSWRQVGKPMLGETHEDDRKTLPETDSKSTWKKANRIQ